MARLTQIPLYTTGTIAIDAGGNVTGSSTNFLSPDGTTNWTIAGGDILVCGNKFGIVSTITDANHLTLDCWSGGVVAAGASYKINRYSGVPNSAIYGLYQKLMALGSALNPFPALSTICGTAAKILFDSDAGGNVVVKVRSTAGGKTDADFVTAATIDPATGAMALTSPQVAAVGQSGVVQIDAGSRIGANGALSFSPSVFANVIDNPSMAIAQHGATFATVAGGSVTLDRWRFGWSGASPAVAQVASGTGYTMQITGAVGNTACKLFQNIESSRSRKFVGGPATVGAVLSSSVAQTVKCYVYYANVVDSFGPTTWIATGTFSVTSTPTEFSVSIPSMPAGAANGLQIQFLPQNGGAFTTGALTITDVSLEPGSYRKPFVPPPPALDLMMCQRHYQTSDYNILRVFASGAWNGGMTSIKFPVTMRATPIVTIATAAGSAGLTTSSIGTVPADDGCLFSFATSGTAGQYVYGTYTASAEL